MGISSCALKKIVSKNVIKLHVVLTMGMMMAMMTVNFWAERSLILIGGQVRGNQTNNKQYYYHCNYERYKKY